MMNVVTLVGRLTKDPELKHTPNGVAVANFTVAVNRPFRNQQGEQEADFINCVAWRKPAENLANFQKKGSLIGVEGSIQTRNYEGQDGKTVYVTEVLVRNITFLEPSRNNNQQGQVQGGGNYGYAQQPQQTQQQYQQQQPMVQPQMQQQGQPMGFNQPNAQQQAPVQQQTPNQPLGQMQPIDISDDDLPF